MHRGVLLATVFAGVIGCASEDGCVEPLPGPFPDAEKVPNGIQLRLTQSGLSVVGEHVDSALGALMPDGLDFEVPQSCGGTLQICCGAAPGVCGVSIDLGRRDGDDPRLEVLPAATADQPADVALRMRIRTGPGPLPVRYDGLFISASCTVTFDTQRSGAQSVTAFGQLGFAQDPITGTTRVSFGDVDVADLDKGDIDIQGGLVCDIAELFKGSFVDILRDMIVEQAGSIIESQLCKPCETGDECAPHGTCTAEGVCEIDDGAERRCLQEIGLAGRLHAATLLPGLSQDSTFDLYAVAGGYAATPANGVSLGIVSGARVEDLSALTCGPPAPPPPLPEAIAPFAALQGNEIAGVGAFDFGIGVHESVLDRVAWSAYHSGMLCATMETATMPLLNSDALGIMMPSLVELLDERTSQLALHLRPQAPPTVRIGGPALFSIDWPELHVDLYAWIDRRFVRLFTAQVDLELPFGLEVDADGAVLPTLDATDAAFAGARVQGTGLLKETDDQLSDRFAALGSLAVPLLTNAIGPIQIPELVGFDIRVPGDGIQRMDDERYVAIFGHLTPAVASRRLLADTAARIVRITSPAPADAETGALGPTPTVEVAVGGVDIDGRDGDLEWQLRVDRGAWSPFTRSRTIVLAREQFRLRGDHIVEVRARAAGRPETTDPTPVVLVASTAVAIPTAPAPVARAHTAGGGCTIARPRATAARWLAMLCVALILAGARRAPPALLILAAASACTGTVTGGGELGEPPPRASPSAGRWNDIATDGTRVLVVGYDRRFGDLVVAEPLGSGEPELRAVLGVPPGPVVGATDGYRGGVLAPGADLGAWCSAALWEGRGRVAFQDRDTRGLAFAIEGLEQWTAHAVDELAGAEIGAFASLTLSRDGEPGIAYLAADVPRGDSDAPYASQLRWAQARSPSPRSADDWTIEIVTEAAVSEPTGEIDDLHMGSGLFASAGRLPDGRPVIAHYDRDGGDLYLSVRDGDGWRATALDVDPETDTGRWASLAVAPDGTVHVAYQDAGNGHLRYVTWLDGEAGSVELVDLGDDAAPRHAVGASATVTLDANDAPEIYYQDSFDVELRVARRQPDGGWSRARVLADQRPSGFATAIAHAGSGTWLSTFVYDFRNDPPGALIVQELP